MKKLFALKLGIILCVVFFAAHVNFAQSGRTISVSPETALQNASENKSSLCAKNSNEIEYIGMTERDGFIERINKLGACGYRAEKIVRAPLKSKQALEQMSFSGLFRKDSKNKFEYSWFIAETPGRAQTLSNDLAAKGFYLKKAFSFRVGAKDEETEEENQKNQGRDTDIRGEMSDLNLGSNLIFMLFERKIGNPKNNEYRIIDANIPKTKFKENEQKMQDLILKGFRPVELWSFGYLQYHFLIMEKDEEIKPLGEYIFDKERFGVEKDLTKYAEQGFDLLIRGTNFSILHRTSPSPRNVRYYRFDDFQKLKKQFAALLPNARFIETGIDLTFKYNDLYETNWFFAVPLKSDENAPPKEWVFLNINEIHSEYKTKNAVPKKIDLTARHLKEIEEEITERLNRLLKDNYEIKNFNYLSGFTIMLERKF